MQPTYFASFLLGARPDEPLPAISDIHEEIFDWIYNNPHRSISRPPNWPSSHSHTAEFESGERVQFLKLEIDNVIRATGVRFEHSEDNRRFWRTDCILDFQQHSGKAIRFSIMVAVGSLASEMSPRGAPSSRPRIVTSVLQKFKGRESLPLTSSHLNVMPEEAQRFVEFLFDTERTMPVVFMSRRNSGNTVLWDSSDLSHKLAGVAYVCVATNADVSREMARFMDNSLNTYDGGIRVYWPGMNPSDSPYRHRLWVPQTIAAINRTSTSLSDQLLRNISSSSVMRRVTGITRWEDIEREIARNVAEKLSENSINTGVSQEWLKQYEADLDALAQKSEELEALDTRLREKEEELRQWKRLYLQSLRTRTVDGSEKADDEDVDLTTAIDAINEAKSRYIDQLHFLDGRISKESEQFEEAELLYAAFTWLATIYRDARLGIKKCSDFDISCREMCGFRYSAHQSSVTMGMFASDYEVNWQGKVFKLREHIGYGSSTKPQFTIRVAFFFDEEINKVIVGYIGQHQANRKSN